MNKGHFIVIEGTDGAGKTTQIKLLETALKKLKKSYQIIDFPRYQDNEYGKLVERYLTGEFGALGEVSPYLASLAYAGDRLLAKEQIEKWLNSGKIVLANRYVSANKGHMSAKLKGQEKEKYLTWIDHLEYGINKIPREELIILLYVDPEVARQNIGARGKFRDIHEVDLNYQKEVARAFLNLAKENNWVVINCAKKGQMRPAEEIHREIMAILSKKGVI